MTKDDIGLQTNVPLNSPHALQKNIFDIKNKKIPTWRWLLLEACFSLFRPFLFFQKKNSVSRIDIPIRPSRVVEAQVDIPIWPDGVDRDPINIPIQPDDVVYLSCVWVLCWCAALRADTSIQPDDVILFLSFLLYPI